jgi:hypothetical protein
VATSGGFWVAIGATGEKLVNRHTLINAVVVCSSFALSALLFAADTPARTTASGGGSTATNGPIEKCFAHLRTFSAAMRKQGYWMEGADYGSGLGYGYPIGIYGYGYGGGLGGGYYGNARPGYEVRTLLASARILALNGQGALCETVLAATRAAYDRYLAELRAAGFTPKDHPDFRQQQIATAQPVIDMGGAFRSDQLIDVDIVNPRNETLGSAHDLIISPVTGKIAYVVVARGGLFGIDESYTPVPWKDFKASPNAGLLVLDTTKPVLEAAPQGRERAFTKEGGFVTKSQQVDTYWSGHVTLATTK